jgi:hypothetical protein
MKKLFIVTLAATSLIFGALPAVAHSAAPIPMPYRAADPSVQADFMIFVNQHQAAMTKFISFPAGNATAWIKARYTRYPAGTKLVWKDGNGNLDQVILF